MTTLTKTIYLHAVVRKGDSQPFFSITDSDMGGIDDWTIVGRQEVTFELPETNDILPDVVRGLEKKRDLMRATASAAITEVDNQIASLLAIENQS
jgi:hypothetical protein